MPLPQEIDSRNLLYAMERFDSEFRASPDWAHWTDNEIFKYAIFHHFNLYPVKQIISMATGVSRETFSGGDQANSYVAARGFSVIPLRDSSWVIRSGAVATKILDKSAFTQGTGIPIEIRPFFMKDDLRAEEHRPVTLIVGTREFAAYIAIESSPTARTRLFWHSDFVRILAEKFPDHYRKCTSGEDIKGDQMIAMNLERMEGYGCYRISFADVASSQKPAEGQESPRSQESEWTDSELDAAVNAYLWMLEQETSGKSYNKAEVNRSLRKGPLTARTKASVEYRMQNISAALQELCLPWIKGYLPARNVGTGVNDRIRGVLAKVGTYSRDDYVPSADPDAFERKVQKLRKRVLTGIPRGQQHPEQSIATSTTYARDPLVKAWVLQNAKGTCEGCGAPAPFYTPQGEPFLEIHHVRTLADGGSDEITNAVALCPNCHRRCHVSADKTSFVGSLLARVFRLQRRDDDTAIPASGMAVNTRSNKGLKSTR